MTIHHMMMEMTFTCEPPDHSVDEFDGLTTRVMDALCDLEEVDSGILDADIMATLAELKLSVYMGIEADSSRDAERLFSANVRTALHAAGCWTEGWEPPADLPTPRAVDLADA